MPESTDGESNVVPLRSKEERWEGGRVRWARGRKVWLIERRIGPGRRRLLTLNARTIDEAKAELLLFERDPANYQSPRQKARDAAPSTEGGVYLDEETLRDFFTEQQARVDRGDLTSAYVHTSLKPYLKAWARAFAGRDLRRVALNELKAALKKEKTAHHKRVVALKAFTAWAREDGRLTRAEDPTQDLPTPEVRAAKSVKAKGYSIAAVEELYASLPSQAARDTIRLRATLGLHDSEIDRIAQGLAELRRVDDPSGIAGVIVFRHLKKGGEHAVSCDAAALAAAERMQNRGSGLARSALATMVNRVAIRKHGCTGVTKVYEVKTGKRKGEKIWETKPCKGCSPIHPGELRHSFATWSTTVGKKVTLKGKKGVPLAEVAEAMGHLGKKTTKTFYVGDRVPMMIKLPIRLAHPEDPA